MKSYPTWKYVILVVASGFGAIYAAPNIYGDDPSVQISQANRRAAGRRFRHACRRHSCRCGRCRQSAMSLEETQWIVRFDSPTLQLQGADLFKRELGRQYVVALNLASKTPERLRAPGRQADEPRPGSARRCALPARSRRRRRPHACSRTHRHRSAGNAAQARTCATPRDARPETQAFSNSPAKNRSRPRARCWARSFRNTRWHVAERAAAAGSTTGRG